MNRAVRHELAAVRLGVEELNADGVAYPLHARSLSNPTRQHELLSRLLVGLCQVCACWVMCG
jgi:hypothetical protein